MKLIRISSLHCLRNGANIYLYFRYLHSFELYVGILVSLLLTNLHLFFHLINIPMLLICAFRSFINDSKNVTHYLKLFEMINEIKPYLFFYFRAISLINCILQLWIGIDPPYNYTTTICIPYCYITQHHFEHQGLH